MRGGGIGSLYWRLLGKAHQFGTKEYQAEGNRCDSKGNLSSFFVGCRTSSTWIFCHLALCTHTPTAHTCSYFWILLFICLFVYLFFFSFELFTGMAEQKCARSVPVVIWRTPTWSRHESSHLSNYLVEWKKKGPARKQKPKRRNDAIGEPSLRNSSWRFTAPECNGPLPSRGHTCWSVAHPCQVSMLLMRSRNVASCWHTAINWPQLFFSGNHTLKSRSSDKLTLKLLSYIHVNRILEAWAQEHRRRYKRQTKPRWRRSRRRTNWFVLKKAEVSDQGRSAGPKSHMSTSGASTVWRPRREIKLISTRHCLEYQRLSW